MPARTPAIAAAAERVGQFILIIRRQRVLLDEDLAALRESQAISNFRAGYHQQYLAKNPDGYCGIGGCGVPFKLAELQVGEKA
jgi:hypothetical protein